MGFVRKGEVELSAKTVVALDLGTKMGWAVLEDGQRFSGTEEFQSGRFEGGGMRYLRFRRWLAKLGPGEVYFEEVRFSKTTDAAHVYGGMLATLTAWCEEHGVPYMGVPVKTVKKHATQNGNAGKPAMVAAARARGWEPRDDNEADALWILDWAIQNMTEAEIAAPARS
jgi:crossover junction endodeoxyribonuclease RuvC